MDISNNASGCVYPTINCNDNNICTNDTCIPASGCKYTNVTCNLCLVAGVPKQCPSSDPCNPQNCDPSTGNCIATPYNCIRKV